MSDKDKVTKAPMCSDLCEHCIYIESGDFICDVTHDVTIVDWHPFPCVCPKKRRNKCAIPLLLSVLNAVQSAIAIHLGEYPCGAFNMTRSTRNDKEMSQETKQKHD